MEREPFGERMCETVAGNDPASDHCGLLSDLGLTRTPGLKDS